MFVGWCQLCAESSADSSGVTEFFFQKSFSKKLMKFRNCMSCLPFMNSQDGSLRAYRDIKYDSMRAISAR